MTDFITSLRNDRDGRFAELAAYLDDLPHRGHYTEKEIDAMARYQREELVCPDCGACADGARLEHQSGCPIADGYDAIQDDDRAFFERFPDVMVRRRKPVLAELLDVALIHGMALPPNPFGKAWTTEGYVLVYRTPIDGFRLKDYGHAWFSTNPDADPDAPVRCITGRPASDDGAA